MIGTIQQNIRKIPSLVVTEVTKQEKALPTVVYFHGFTSAKEHNLPLAYLLAEQGFRVILPDSMYHGERQTNITQSDLQLSFWDIVLQNVQELLDIKQYLDDHELILSDQFGVAGTSMGGITTSAALTKYPWIKVAAILMGSPKITSFAEELIAFFQKTAGVSIPEDKTQPILTKLQKIDLSNQLETLNQRPLLMWHGDNDQVVPYSHANMFYNEARSYYRNQEFIQLITEAGRDHKVSRPAILQTVQWFVHHLKSNNLPV